MISLNLYVQMTKSDKKHQVAQRFSSNMSTVRVLWTLAPKRRDSSL